MQLVDTCWQATFRNTRYALPQGEADFFATPASKSRRVVFDDSVAPEMA